MPMNYQFVRQNDGQAESLEKIDEICCEHQGVEINAKDYCVVFQILQMLGFSIARKSDHDVITDESFERFKAEFPDRLYGPKDWDFAKRMLLTEYHYQAWSTR